MNKLSPNIMSNTIDKYITITFSIVNNSYTCHLYMLITKNYSSNYMNMSFWAPATKSSAENNIPKKSRNTSLLLLFSMSTMLVQIILLNLIRLGFLKGSVLDGVNLNHVVIFQEELI